jgi:hypothetical protein
VPDLLFVLLTVVMFVVLALVVRGGERPMRHRRVDRSSCWPRMPTGCGSGMRA